MKKEGQLWQRFCLSECSQAGAVDALQWCSWQGLAGPVAPHPFVYGAFTWWPPLGEEMEAESSRLPVQLDRDVMWRNLCWVRERLGNFVLSTVPQDTAALSMAIFRGFSLLCSLCRKWTNAWQTVLMNSCSWWVSVPLWCSSSHRTSDCSSTLCSRGGWGSQSRDLCTFVLFFFFCNKRTALQLENLRLEYCIQCFYTG